MNKKKIIAKKGFILGSVIVVLLLGIIGGIKIYKNLDNSKFNNQNNVVEDDKAQHEDETSNEQDNKSETTENDIIDETKESSSNVSNNQNTTNNNSNQNKGNTSNNSSSTNKKTNNNSTNSNTEQNKSTTNEKAQTETKKLTKKEIEDYVRKTISDFRYDFDSIKECEVEGNKWMEYGWIYNCTYSNVPNVDVVPTMLTITTGKLFCDGAYTKNVEYDYRKPKISNLEYLRKVGYPCANIEDN